MHSLLPDKGEALRRIKDCTRRSRRLVDVTVDVHLCRDIGGEVREKA